MVLLIVVGELRAGFATGRRREDNERLLQRFLDAPITDGATKHYAQLYFTLRQAGRPVTPNDMWIAAIALEQGVPLLILDADFSRVPDLAVAKI